MRVTFSDFAAFIIATSFLVAVFVAPFICAWHYMHPPAHRAAASHAHSPSVSIRGGDPSRPGQLRSTMGREQGASEHGVRHAPGSLDAIEAGRGHSLLYEVTAYSHGCILPRDGRPEGHARRAANGRWPVADVTVAADTSIHPFGTELLIEGLGFRSVGDRGHVIKGRKLDLFVDTCREAREFGRRWLKVHTVPAESQTFAKWSAQ